MRELPRGMDALAIPRRMVEWMSRTAGNYVGVRETIAKVMTARLVAGWVTIGG